MKKQVCMVMATIMLAGFAQVAQSDTFGSGGNQFTMDFTTIGNAGNGADTNGIGAVDYTYRIGQYEVTIDQFEKMRASAGIGAGNESFWNSVGSDAPAVNVSFNEAAAFCNWLTSGSIFVGAYQLNGAAAVTNVMTRPQIQAAGGTFYVIPTEDEWYKAAYFTGGGYSHYANGTDTAPLTSESRYSDTAPWIVGSGASEQNNTYDMMGNVAEWTETANLSNAVLRGGAYIHSVAGMGSDWTASQIIGGEGNVFGIRVAAVIPEPGTISLMSLSTISLFFTRTLRRRKKAGITLAPIRRESFADAFCSEEEWLRQQAYTEDVDDALTSLVLAVKAECATLWTGFSKQYKSFDKVFWNWMVKRYERKKVRQLARRKALKKKIVDSFDAFLALIMK